MNFNDLPEIPGVHRSTVLCIYALGRAAAYHEMIDELGVLVEHEESKQARKAMALMVHFISAQSDENIDEALGPGTTRHLKKIFDHLAKKGKNT